MSLDPAITVVRYESTDAGAPVLTGEAGTLVFLLDKCLVDGYGSVTLTSLTQAAGIATGTTAAAHGFQIDQVVLLAGATPAAYNGLVRVLTVTTTAFTFAIDAATASPASGTITTKRPSLGWSKPFSATNQAAYRQPAGSNQMYLFVDDALSGTTQRNAYVRGFETMSDLVTGTGAFPTTAQLANGDACYKSATQDSVARAWTLVGDGKLFYLFTRPYSTGAPTAANTLAFGDFGSYKPGDAYNTLLIARSTAGTATNGSSADAGDWMSRLEVSNSVVGNGHYLPRSYTQISTGIGFYKIGSAVGSGSAQLTAAGPNTAGSAVSCHCISGRCGMDYPSPVDNGYHIAPIQVGELSFYRGLLPGVYQPMHDAAAIPDGTLIQDIVGLTGKKVRHTLLSGGDASRPTGNSMAIDVIGPWSRA